MRQRLFGRGPTPPGGRASAWRAAGSSGSSRLNRLLNSLTTVTVNRSELRSILVLAVLCGFLFFFGLANFGLLGADEPRYAQIGREMLERNDWVTPRLHGEVWLEKPVLYYWLEMVAYKLFGVSDWAARLPAAVLGVILIVAIYAFCRRFRPGAQLEAAVITA